VSKITSRSAKPLGKAAGLAAGFIAALALIGIGTVARAATITIDSVTDDTNAGHCTLREAINSANGSPGTGNCTAGTGTDSIVFSVTGTIILGGKLPIIAGNLTITGPGSPGITIDGNNKFQVMQVDSSATLNLNKLTIARGKGEGAGIHNSGTLTVTNSIFADNNNFGGDGGGGIFSSGTLTVTNSTFSGNTADGVFGGGINNSLGTLTVTNSTFSDSRADSAGGIANSGTMTVTNSTFSNNRASLGGGGIFNTGTMTVTNSTFSGNTVGVGGGAIENARGTVHLKGTILADETTGDNCFGTITDAGYNISGDGSCGFSAAGSRNSTNPKLDSAGLKDHGGPTQTIALQTGSLAIDAIPFASCTDQAAPPKRIATDQRGFGRPDPEDGPSGPCDIGAYESGQPPPTPTKDADPDPYTYSDSNAHTEGDVNRHPQTPPLLHRHLNPPPS
jgi:fibronectin-binding autotransporter adhesin